jgi:hypothetical protein
MVANCTSGTVRPSQSAGDTRITVGCTLRSRSAGAGPAAIPSNEPSRRPCYPVIGFASSSLQVLSRSDADDHKD